MSLDNRPCTCVDRPLPPSLRADVGDRRATPWYARPDGARGVALTNALWIPGQTIRLAFLRGGKPPGGDSSIVERRIQSAAKAWAEHANLTFQWVEGAAAIRISFEDAGSWSYIGTTCLEHPEGSTMNFGWLSSDLDESSFRAVVLHELGHALGMIHEHQSPAAGIDWNHDAVYEYYDGPPNHWSRTEVEHNLFSAYDATVTQFSAYDSQSIMAYPIPAEHLSSGDPVGWNTELSDGDKAFIASLYPYPPTHST